MAQDKARELVAGILPQLAEHMAGLTVKSQRDKRKYQENLDKATGGILSNLVAKINGGGGADAAAGGALYGDDNNACLVTALANVRVAMHPKGGEAGPQSLASREWWPGDVNALVPNQEMKLSAALDHSTVTIVTLAGARYVITLEPGTKAKANGKGAIRVELKGKVKTGIDAPVTASKVLELDANGNQSLGLVYWDAAALSEPKGLAGERRIKYTADLAMLVAQVRITAFPKLALQQLQDAHATLASVGITTSHNDGGAKNLCQFMALVDALLRFLGVGDDKMGGADWRTTHKGVYKALAEELAAACKTWAQDPVVMAARVKKSIGDLSSFNLKPKDEAGVVHPIEKPSPEGFDALLSTVVVLSVLHCVPDAQQDAAKAALRAASPAYAQAVAAEAVVDVESDPLGRQLLSSCISSLGTAQAGAFDDEAAVVNAHEGLAGVRWAVERSLEINFGQGQQACDETVLTASSLFATARLFQLIKVLAHPQTDAVARDAEAASNHIDVEYFKDQDMPGAGDLDLPLAALVFLNKNHWEFANTIDAAEHFGAPIDTVDVKAIQYLWAALLASGSTSAKVPAAAGACPNCAPAVAGPVCEHCAKSIAKAVEGQKMHTTCGMERNSGGKIENRVCICCAVRNVDLHTNTCAPCVKKLGQPEKEKAKQAQRDAEAKKKEEQDAATAAARAEADLKQAALAKAAEDAKMAEAKASALAKGQKPPSGAACANCGCNFLPNKPGHKMCGACALKRKEANAQEEDKKQEADRAAAEAAQFQSVTRTCTKCGVKKLGKHNKSGLCGDCGNSNGAAAPAGGGSGGGRAPQTPPKCPGCKKADKPANFPTCRDCHIKAAKSAPVDPWTEELKALFAAMALAKPYRDSAGAQKHKVRCGMALRAGVDPAHVIAHMTNRRLCVFGNKCKDGDQCKREHAVPATTRPAAAAGAASAPVRPAAAPANNSAAGMHNNQATWAQVVKLQAQVDALSKAQSAAAPSAEIRFTRANARVKAAQAVIGQGDCSQASADELLAARMEFQAAAAALSP